MPAGSFKQIYFTLIRKLISKFKHVEDGEGNLVSPTLLFIANEAIDISDFFNHLIENLLFWFIANDKINISEGNSFTLDDSFLFVETFRL